jgi:hypothetical protein
MMSEKIDVSEIMKELEDKIKKGLAEKKLDMTGISRLITEHVEKAKEKILQDAGELISGEMEPGENEKCMDCGRDLKKTKKETSP